MFANFVQMPNPLATALVLLVGTLVFWAVKLTSRWKDAPPGPPTVPMIGNLHQISRKDLHLQYQRWGEQYGPIFSLKLGSQNMVVLTSGEMIKRLLDKRSANYADRPNLYMQDIWEHSRIIMRGYDALWKVERKLYHRFLNVSQAPRYTPYQDLETKKLCYDLLSNPDDFETLITRATLSVAASMAFGFRVVDTKSKVMQELLHNAHGFFTMVYNSRLLDWYPQLRRVVKILPSSLYPTKKKAKAIYIREKTQFLELFNETRKKAMAGGKRPSFAVDIFTAQNSWDDEPSRALLTDQAASYISGIAFEGGGDTSSNTLAGLIKAMMLFPDVQRKAQNEIDSVIGPERMPSMEDFESLPYIRQTIKEALRWLPTAINGAIPHAAVNDDVVDGYRIPAGTTVVLAVWAANNDPALFPNPREFDPSRHDPHLSFAESAAAPDISKHGNWTFGAGRRICPGMHVAERTLFLAAARLLWGFNITKARGTDGQEIDVDRDEVTQSIAARPISFPCSIKPRSEQHVTIIMKDWSKSEEILDETGNYKDVVIQ